MKKEIVSLNRKFVSLENLFCSPLTNDITSPICFIKNDGTLIYVNKSFSKLFKATNKKLTGQNLIEIFPAVYHKKIVSALHSFQKGKTKPVKKISTAFENNKIVWTFFTLRNANKQTDSLAVLGKNILEEKLNLSLPNNDNFYHQVIFSLLKEAVFIHDAETFSFIDVNKAACKMFGYSNKELLNLNIEQLSAGSSPYSQKEAIRFLQKAKKGIPQLFEWKAKRKSGELFWVEADARLLKIEGKKILSVSVSDITERKSVEKLLHDDEMYLDVIIESTNDGILAVDNKGKIIKSNRRFAEMWKIPDNMIKSRNREGMLHFILDQLIDPNQFLDKVKLLYKTPDDDSDVLHFKDGRVFDRYSQSLKSGNKLLGRVWSFRDVTERKKSEQTLLENETKYRELVNNSPDAIAIYSEGKIIFVNNECIRLLHASDKAEMLGQPVMQYVHPESLPLVKERIKKFTAPGIVLPLAEEKFIRLDGSVVDVEVKAMSILYNGKLAVQLIARDISDRKIAEESIKQAELKYRTLFMNANDAIFLMNEDTFVDCNPKTEELFECTRNDILNHKPYEFSPPFQPDKTSSKEKALEKIHNVFAGKPQVFEWTHKKLNGALFYAEVSLNKIEIANKPMLQAIVRDITDRKKALEELNKNKMYLEKAEKIAGFGNWILFLEQNRMAASEGAKLIYGISQNELSFSEVKHIPLPEYRTLLDESLTNLIENNIPYEIEFKIKRQSDGEIRSVYSIAEYDNSTRTVFGIIQDITIRKNTEEAIRNQRRLLRTLIDLIPDAVYVKDLSGKKILANPKDVELCGCETEQEVIGKTDFDLYPEANAKRSYEEEQLVLKEEKSLLNIEGLLIDKYGTEHSLLGSKVPLRNADGIITGIVGINHDITEFKKTQNALKQSEELYRNLINTLPESVTLADRKGNILFSSPKALELYGYSADDSVLGMNIFDFVAEESYETALTNLDLLIKKGQIESSEYTLRKKDGKKFIAEIVASLVESSDPNRMKFLLVSRDITLRKQADKLLQEGEESYHGLFNSVDEAIYIQDETGKFIDVNIGAVKMYGFPREYFIGKNPADLGAEGLNDMNEIILKVNKALAGETQQFEFWAVKSNGTKFLKDVHLTKGKYFGKDVIIATATDITERKQNEEKIITALNEKEVLLKEVHHRVKNNLQAIIFLIEMQNESITDAAIKQFLLELQERARTMSLVYERLYQSEFLSSVEMQPFFEALTSNILHSFSAEKQITSIIDAAGITLDVELAMPCGLIVNELLTNSLKYAFSDKTVSNCSISIEMKVENNFCNLIVKDNGIGLPAVFDWKQADSLGLKLVNLWAGYQLKGKIELNRDNGTSFNISFPLSERK